MESYTRPDSGSPLSILWWQHINTCNCIVFCSTFWVDLSSGKPLSETHSDWLGTSTCNPRLNPSSFYISDRTPVPVLSRLPSAEIQVCLSSVWGKILIHSPHTLSRNTLTPRMDQRLQKASLGSRLPVLSRRSHPSVAVTARLRPVVLSQLGEVIKYRT